MCLAVPCHTWALVPTAGTLLALRVRAPPTWAFLLRLVGAASDIFLLKKLKFFPPRQKGVQEQMLTAGDAAHFKKISIVEANKNKNNINEVVENMNMLFWTKKNFNCPVYDMRDCVKGVVMEGTLPEGTHLYHMSPFLKSGFPDGDITFYSLNPKDLFLFFSPYLNWRYPNRKNTIHTYKVKSSLRVLILHPGFTAYDWAEEHMYESELIESAEDIDYRDDIFREIGRRGEYDAIFTIQNQEIDLLNEVILFDRVKGNKIVWLEESSEEREECAV